jgi:hypothetical protein
MSSEYREFLRSGKFRRAIQINPRPELISEFELNPANEPEANFLDFVNRLVLSSVLKEDSSTGSYSREANVFVPEEICQLIDDSMPRARRRVRIRLVAPDFKYRTSRRLSVEVGKRRLSIRYNKRNEEENFTLFQVDEDAKVRRPLVEDEIPAAIAGVVELTKRVVRKRGLFSW